MEILMSNVHIEMIPAACSPFYNKQFNCCFNANSTHIWRTDLRFEKVKFTSLHFMNPANKIGSPLGKSLKFLFTLAQCCCCFECSYIIVY